MAAPPAFSILNFTPLLLSIFLLLHPSTSSLNITTLLSAYPSLSEFNKLLSGTDIPADLTTRSSLTLLAVPNSYLRSSSSSDLTHRSYLPDILRYHVLLQYFSWPNLRQIPPAGKLVTTLFQTTGRATNNLGAVNITVGLNGSVSVRSPVPFSASNATILSLIKALPYNVSIFTVNSLLVPFGNDLTASETLPPSGLNITRVLIDGKNFNVAASMLMASGVEEEFEADEKGAGITVFVPTDSAFADLPVTERFQSLPAERKAVILKFHVLHSYYPLGSLESIVNPVQPTVATEDMGAGRFTMNISRVNGSVAIDTGIVQATITQTVFDQSPVAIFAVSRVLLPREIFGKEALVGRGAGEKVASPPEIAVSPQNSLGLVTPPSRVSSPTDFGRVRSGGDGQFGGVFGVGLFCIALCVLV